MVSVIIEMAPKCSWRTIEMVSVIIDMAPDVFLENHRDGLSDHRDNTKVFLVDHRDGLKGFPKDHRDGPKSVTGGPQRWPQ